MEPAQARQFTSPHRPYWCLRRIGLGTSRLKTARRPEVKPVSGAQARTQSLARHLTLNTDGHHHPLINAAAAYTVVAGIAALTIGMLNVAHMAGTILGLTGMVIGLLAQMMSVTRAERIVIVFGVVVSFVGMGLGFAHGGFG